MDDIWNVQNNLDQVYYCMETVTLNVYYKKLTAISLPHQSVHYLIITFQNCNLYKSLPLDDYC